MKDKVSNNHLCLGGEFCVVEVQAPVLAQGWTVKRPFTSVCDRCCVVPQEAFFGEVVMEESCGQCLFPGEPGSAGDGTGLLLTSHLLQGCSRECCQSRWGTSGYVPLHPYPCDRFTV